MAITFTTMELSKATIEPKGKAKIEVLFNPNQYSLDKSNQFAEIGVPGLQAPIVQYVRGNTQTLSMELFFDTYEQRTDVRDHTNQIYDLLGIESELHVPPVCKISWGTLNFNGVLDKVSGKFTLFLPNGIPVRATLNVTFKEYIKVNVLVRQTNTQSADHVKTRTVKRGDTLSAIAAAEYGDPSVWRPIAQANGIKNPRDIRPGQTLAIPRLRSQGGDRHAS